MPNFSKWSKTVFYTGSVGMGYGYRTANIGDVAYFAGKSAFDVNAYDIPLVYRKTDEIPYRNTANSNNRQPRYRVAESVVGHDLYSRYFNASGVARVLGEGRDNYYSGLPSAQTKRALMVATQSNEGSWLGNRGSSPVHLSTFFNTGMDLSQQRAFQWKPLLGWGTKPSEFDVIGNDRLGMNKITIARHRCQHWMITAQNASAAPVDPANGLKTWNLINLRMPYHGGEVVITVAPQVDLEALYRTITIKDGTDRNLPALFGLEINTRCSILINIPYMVMRRYRSRHHSNGPVFGGSTTHAFLRLLNVFHINSSKDESNVLINFYHPLGNMLARTINQDSGLGDVIYGANMTNTPWLLQNEPNTFYSTHSGNEGNPRIIEYDAKAKVYSYILPNVGLRNTVGFTF